MRPLALAAALTGLITSVALLKAKDDEFVINIASPKKGDKVKVTVTENSTTTIKMTVDGKDVMPPTVEKKKKEFTYTDNVKNGDPKSRTPTNIERVYETAKIDGQDVASLLVEKSHITIVGSREDYRFTQQSEFSKVEDLKDPTALEVLKAEFGKGSSTDIRFNALLSPDGVKEKEIWKIKPGQNGSKTIAESFKTDAFRLKEDQAEIIGELQDVLNKPKKDEKNPPPLQGKVKITFTAPVSQYGPKNSTVTLSKDKMKESKLTVTVDGTGCIDGRSPDGKITTTLELQIFGKLDGFDLDINVKSIEERKTDKK